MPGNYELQRHQMPPVFEPAYGGHHHRKCGLHTFIICSMYNDAVTIEAEAY